MMNRIMSLSNPCGQRVQQTRTHKMQSTQMVFTFSAGELDQTQSYPAGAKHHKRQNLP